MGKRVMRSVKKRKVSARKRKAPSTPPQQTLTPAQSTEITGNEVALLRHRLDWAVPDFANLFSVSLSTIGRWEGCGKGPITADPHGRRLLKVLSSVLDSVHDARERLSAVRDEGPHRVLFVLLGLYYGDAPWLGNEKRSKAA